MQLNSESNSELFSCPIFQNSAEQSNVGGEQDPSLPGFFEVHTVTILVLDFNQELAANQRRVCCFSLCNLGDFVR